MCERWSAWPGRTREIVWQVGPCLTRGVSGWAFPAGLEFCDALADAVLVCDRVPSRSAALAGSADLAGCFEISEQPEHMVAVPVGPLGELGRCEAAVL